jgi:hypothetical protein
MKNLIVFAVLAFISIASAAPLSIRFVGYSDTNQIRHITLTVPNTSTNYLYGIYRRSTITGSEVLVGTNFVGNGGEVTAIDTVQVGDFSHFYRARQEDGFIHWIHPGSATGSQPPCPGTYIGYGNGTLTVAEGWGWYPDTNATSHLLVDPFRNDTHFVWLSDYGQSDCDGSTTIVNLTYGTRIRYSLYFPSNLPSVYPVRMIGWTPAPAGGADQLEALSVPSALLELTSTSASRKAVRSTTLTAEQIAVRRAAIQKIVDQLNAAFEQAKAASAARTTKSPR